jgi:tRNA-splicing ligase RtcB
MKVVTTEKRPVKMWLNDIEEGALAQAKNLANLPFTFKHIALMPDAHQGYGMPIGGVMATKGVVVPNAVGVDIGCGMCAVKTDISSIGVGLLKKIMSEIRQAVPVGFKKHSEPQLGMPEMGTWSMSNIASKEYLNAEKSLGTLGGGNHFIEIQKGSDGHIWFMIHSGSRNLGKKVADHYNGLAVELNERWHSKVPAEWQLAFLPLDSDEGYAYIQEMNDCTRFAYANRQLMSHRIADILKVYANCEILDTINIAHNYATMEHHFNQNVMVHRKGATAARKGQPGIIPGSQGTSSYIVRGKGNSESFESCSHGAGRKMGRKQAQRELNLAEEQKRLDDMGVIHGIRNEKDLDEAAGAYKDIVTVMANQTDLVDIVVGLKPIAVIKG